MKKPLIPSHLLYLRTWYELNEQRKVKPLLRRAKKGREMTCVSLHIRACAVRYKIINRKGYLSTRTEHIEGREVKMKPLFGGSTPGLPLHGAVSHNMERPY
jgi:hypothetical protein